MFGKLSPRLAGARARLPTGILQVNQNVRLYATTGVPVPTGDTTTVSTIYVGPYNGAYLTTLDASDNYLTNLLFEVSLALSGLTSGKAYDVFVHWNGSTPVISLSSAWTDNTTRADAVATVKGLVVLSSDHTKLHIGTIYTTGTSSAEDTLAKRYVWNRYNQQRSAMTRFPTTSSWTFATASYRAWNGDGASHEIAYVTGDASTFVEATTDINWSMGTYGQFMCHGIGVDATNTNSAQTSENFQCLNSGGAIQHGGATYMGKPGLGRHALIPLEHTQNGTNTTQMMGTAYGTGNISGSLLN